MGRRVGNTDPIRQSEEEEEEKLDEEGHYVEVAPPHDQVEKDLEPEGRQAHEAVEAGDEEEDGEAAARGEDLAPVLVLDVTGDLAEADARHEQGQVEDVILEAHLGGSYRGRAKSGFWNWNKTRKINKVCG